MKNEIKKHNDGLFSKALFKQSCKANGTMWAIVTVAVCFMLACVMLISGSGAIGEIKNSMQDSIITEEIDSQLQTRSINYYRYGEEGMRKFDETFLKNVAENQAAFANPSTAESAFTAAYAAAAQSVQAHAQKKALEINEAYTAESAESKEIVAAMTFPINPNGIFNAMYANEAESDKPEDYAAPLLTHAAAGDLTAYLTGDERAAYRSDRAEYCAAVFLAFNMTQEDNVEKIVNALSSFGVTKEKYDSFNYTYATIKRLGYTTAIDYRGQLAYEKEQLDKRLTAGEIAADEYEALFLQKMQEVTGDITESLLASLPQEVADALKEIGEMDLYTLIVGSIFYKLAGLLLPIIFTIMAANNLIAGQVDSGSMAYVLSTSTKRKTVAFTQGVFLTGSLLSMFILTSITGCVCLCFVENVSLTYGKLLLLNLGAFLVLFALSGLCFFASCFFDRSKRSMALGGGLSIYALVAAMLGLFGSDVIPSVIRLESLNGFNYTTIITLFDVISIMDGTSAFLWKFAVLAVLGVGGYIAGAIRFNKKDLPL
ncbi:MAG: ABC transporter permease subunit [Candidatus Borkfalkiaceae bacterium]|nr:ABC transporter permease subunit [Clostridia bacterium]MDY6222833.1 ABC transporter permease subunit [Christensenellaceae bacterium]